MVKKSVQNPKKRPLSRVGDINLTKRIKIETSEYGGDNEKNVPFLKHAQETIMDKLKINKEQKLNGTETISNGNEKNVECRIIQQELLKYSSVIDDQVYFGPNKTNVPISKWTEIKFDTEYSKVVRSLMNACFTRHEMATHTLTGRINPKLVQNAVHKKKLNEKIVEDITEFISGLYSLEKRLVRVVITKKCVDEHKFAANNLRELKENESKKLHEDVNQAGKTENSFISDSELSEYLLDVKSVFNKYELYECLNELYTHFGFNQSQNEFNKDMKDIQYKIIFPGSQN